MTLLKTAALSAALFGAAGAGAGAVVPPAYEQDQSVRAVSPRAFEVITSGGRIGVTVSELQPGEGKATAGVVVDVVEEESPAARAGVRKGDVVVEFDGERVRSVRQFTRVVGETPPGRQVAAALLRDGQRVSINLTPRETSVSRFFNDGTWQTLDNLRDFTMTVPPIPARPARPAPAPRAPRAQVAPRPPMAPRPPVLESFGWTRGNQLGVTVSTLSDQLGEYFGAKNGVLVTDVTEDSAAAKAGIKAGDVIVSVNGSQVETSADISRHMQRLGSGEEFTVNVLREKRTLTLKGKVETRTNRRGTIL